MRLAKLWMGMSLLISLSLIATSSDASSFSIGSFSSGSGGAATAAAVTSSFTSPSSYSSGTAVQIGGNSRGTVSLGGSNSRGTVSLGNSGGVGSTSVASTGSSVLTGAGSAVDSGFTSSVDSVMALEDAISDIEQVDFYTQDNSAIPSALSDTATVTTSSMIDGYNDDWDDMQGLVDEVMGEEKNREITTTTSAQISRENAMKKQEENTGQYLANQPWEDMADAVEIDEDSNMVIIGSGRQTAGAVIYNTPYYEGISETLDGDTDLKNYESVTDVLGEVSCGDTERKGILGYNRVKSAEENLRTEAEEKEEADKLNAAIIPVENVFGYSETSSGVVLQEDPGEELLLTVQSSEDEPESGIDSGIDIEKEESPLADENEEENSTAYSNDEELKVDFYTDDDITSAIPSALSDTATETTYSMIDGYNDDWDDMQDMVDDVMGVEKNREITTTTSARISRENAMKKQEENAGQYLANQPWEEMAEAAKVDTETGIVKIGGSSGIKAEISNEIDYEKIYSTLNGDTDLENYKPIEQVLVDQDGATETTVEYAPGHYEGFNDVSFSNGDEVYYYQEISAQTSRTKAMANIAEREKNRDLNEIAEKLSNSVHLYKY